MRTAALVVTSLMVLGFSSAAYAHPGHHYRARVAAHVVRDAVWLANHPGHRRRHCYWHRHWVGGVLHRHCRWHR